MAVNLWSPRGDCHIGLTSGHTFVVPGDRGGAEVPQKFRKEALARGCVPVGTELKPPDTFDRAAVIRGGAKCGVATPRARVDLAETPGACGTVAVDARAPVEPETTVEARAADHIVAASLGDRVVDRIAHALQGAGDAGLTRTELRDMFHRNLSADRIRVALELLQRRGMATCGTASPRTIGGRPPQVWRAAK